jgi:hypothetical protein
VPSYLSKLGLSVMFYDFSALVDPRHVVDSFWFEVRDPTTQGPPNGIALNGGKGFRLRDDSIFIDHGRCQLLSFAATGRTEFTLVVAVSWAFAVVNHTQNRHLYRSEKTISPLASSSRLMTCLLILFLSKKDSM